MTATSTKPYLLRAIYEWCTDNGFTPYISVAVDANTVVPQEHVKNGQIVLNISFTATKGLKIENEYIYFNARFSGVARDLIVPVNNVLAIYASENGQGMAFELTMPSADEAAEQKSPDQERPAAEPATLSAVPDRDPADGDGDGPQPPKKGGARPTLTRIK
ncbi:ClpXP protease specificity-enhancing factor [Lacisediminimonas sp.]|uniref:ClpXP protease specificity-enhancing factor n=1 Tax=Lacisediminimonas sp. TaxID=3060582 RepID=UPI00271FF533|nr:ClpXP protease specificity-enhancing factor [Lacisediminimonas sp.]MDO8298115.1 ClpXP protease specificity-enhancing factor [Lacisediminimonas sp.]MDO9216147.1 ClpXP protease specificity-enhancing factor [Lacisediminimonas sp.]